MSLTYRAVQVTEPGKLELVNRPIPETPAGKVRLRVEACGICHTDGGTVYNAFPGLTLPRVPIHGCKCRKLSIWYEHAAKTKGPGWAIRLPMVRWILEEQLLQS